MQKFVPTLNEVVLCIACFCVWLVNRTQANTNAEWDTAMDFMEWLAKTPGKLRNLHDKFETLAARASERADDLVLERK